MVMVMVMVVHPVSRCWWCSCCFPCKDCCSWRCGSTRAHVWSFKKTVFFLFQKSKLRILLLLHSYFEVKVMYSQERKKSNVKRRCHNLFLRAFSHYVAFWKSSHKILQTSTEWVMNLDVRSEAIIFSRFRLFSDWASFFESAGQELKLCEALNQDCTA